MGYIPPGTLTIAGSLSMSVRIDPATHITKLALELKLMDNNSARDTTLPWKAWVMRCISHGTVIASNRQSNRPCVKQSPPCSSGPVPQCTCALQREPSYGYYWHASHLRLRGTQCPTQPRIRLGTLPQHCQR